MQLSQSQIALLYCYALALGVVLGLFFDLIRFPRMLFSRNANIKKDGAKQSLRKRRSTGVFVFLEDFLFCIVAAVCVILLFYEHNNGKIRPLVFFLLIGGFALYWVTAGRLIRALLRLVVKWLRKAARQAFLLVWKPTKKLLTAIGCALQKQMEKRARKRYTKKLFQMVEQNAAGLLPGGAVLKKKEVSKKQRRCLWRRKKEKRSLPKTKRRGTIIS